MASLYDYPDVFEAVLARPPEVLDIEAETIQTLLAAHGIEEGEVLELACGVCAHGIRLAEMGYFVTGLDQSLALLSAAQVQAYAAGVELTLHQGDVVDYDLGEGRFDAAVFTFETFPLIADDRALRRHFAAVRRSLRAGGVYIFDVDRCLGIRSETEAWGRRTLPLPDGRVELWQQDRPGDWVDGVKTVTLFGRIERQGAVTETQDDWTLRDVRPWDVALLIQTLPGWELDGIYSWQDATQESTGDAHDFVVAVAR
jgi:SAM-dependent methyltransferase